MTPGSGQSPSEVSRVGAGVICLLSFTQWPVLPAGLSQTFASTLLVIHARLVFVTILR